jgi:type III secretory pathway component EscT
MKNGGMLILSALLYISALSFSLFLSVLITSNVCGNNMNSNGIVCVIAVYVLANVTNNVINEAVARRNQIGKI